MDAQPAASPLQTLLSYRRTLTLAGFILFYAFLVWLYYPALDSFFANDDWVILYHNSKIPPGEWWRYFSPKTIWFYRPLQSMQFGLTYHFAGLNHRAYSVQLLIMHLVVCTLAWIFLKQLFGRALAWLATFLFSISWIYVDILLWKANYNTLHHAITTLTACITFTLYLQTRRRRWFWGTIAAAVANCFTKESSVSLPLILGAVWLTVWLQEKWEGKIYAISLGGEEAWWWSIIKKGFKDLWPIGVNILVYVAFHRLLVENVEQNYKPGYEFVSPAKAFGQWMHGTNHSVFGAIHDPLVIGMYPQLQATLLSWTRSIWVIPPIIIIFAWWCKSPLALFGLLFTLVTQFPHFAMANYHASRYYYLSALGGTVIISGILLKALLSAGNTNFSKRIPAYFAVGFTAWFTVSNILISQTIVSRDRQQSFLIQRAFAQLESGSVEIPRQSLILLRGVPSEFMNNGMGSFESLDLVLGRSDAALIVEGQRISEEKRLLLDALPSAFIIDITTSAPALQRVR